MDPKWQKMAAIVNSNKSNLNYSFKKLVITRFITENIFILLLQYMGLMFSVVNPLPIWFSSGTACGFVMLRGVSILPGIFLGSLITFLSMHFNIYLSLLWSTIFTAQAWLLLKLCYQFLRPTLVFIQLNEFMKFIMLISSLSFLVAFVFKYFWYAYFANLFGILIIGVAICYWDMYFPEIYATQNLKLFFQRYSGCGIFFSLAMVAIIGSLILFIFFPNWWFGMDFGL